MSEHAYTLAIRAGHLGFADQFRSREETTRYYLNGVHVEPAPGGGALAVATDGHRLWAGHEPAGVCASAAIVALPKDFLALCRRRPNNWVVAKAPLGKRLPVWMLGALTKRSPPMEPDDAPADPLAWDAPDGEVIIARVSAAVIDGEFPEWRRVMPEMSEKPQPGGTMNAAYLGAFSEVAKWSGGSCGVLVAPSVGNGPVLIKPLYSSRAEWVGVVMPMFGAPEPTIPAWAAPPASPITKPAAANTPKRRTAA